MSRSELVPVAILVAAVGFGLVLWQSIRTITGDTLGTTGEVVLYVGLALFLVATATLVPRSERPAPGPAQNTD